VGQTAEELRARAELQRTELSRDLEAIGDRVSPGRIVERRRAAVRQRFERARDAVMGRADSVRETVRDGTSDTLSSVGDTASGFGERVGSAPEAVRRQTEGNPLAAGLIAFGAGMLLATVIPSSQKEQDVGHRIEPRLSDMADGVKSEVRASVRQVTEQIKPMAEEAVEGVKATAQDAVESVKQEARPQ
jgi:hypothetical protein